MDFVCPYNKKVTCRKDNNFEFQNRVMMKQRMLKYSE